jgi:hypothetical protein
MGDWAWEREPAIDDLQWSSRVAQQVTTTTTTRLLPLLLLLQEEEEEEEEEGEEKGCGEWRAMRARGSNSHSSNSSEWHKGCWWWPTVCLCLPFVMGMVGI